MVAQGTLPDKAAAPKDREKYASYGVILAKNLHFLLKNQLFDSFVMDFSKRYISFLKKKLTLIWHENARCTGSMTKLSGH